MTTAAGEMVKGGRKALLTKREVAEVLQVCERTIENLVARGKLKAVRLGRLVRFTHESVDALVTEAAA